MTSSFAGGRWPTKEAAVLDIQKMLGIDRLSAIYTASVLDQKFGNKYSGKFLNVKSIRHIMNSSIRQGTAPHMKQSDKLQDYYNDNKNNDNLKKDLSYYNNDITQCYTEQQNNGLSVNYAKKACDELFSGKPLPISSQQKQAMKNASIMDRINMTIGKDRGQYQAMKVFEQEQHERQSKFKSGSRIDPSSSAKVFHIIQNHYYGKPIPEQNPHKSDAWLTIENAHRYGGGSVIINDYYNKVKEVGQQSKSTKSASTTTTANKTPPDWKICKDYTSNKSQYQYPEKFNKINNNSSHSTSTDNIKGASNSKMTIPPWILTKRFLFEGY